MSKTFRITESVGIVSPPRLSEAALTRVNEALLPAGGSVPHLEVKIAAIHEGLTRNNTFYSKEGLTGKVPNDQKQMSGLESWTKPYEAPILKNHNSEDVDNTIGRVVEAKWIEKAGSTPGHVEITARITNPDSIQKFIRGEYTTGSIGMDVDSAHCSICSEDLKASPWGGAFHEHERGKWYQKNSDGQWLEAAAHAKGSRRMHVSIGNVWAREYSVVAVPSDMRSKVKSFELKEMLLEANDGEKLNLLDPEFKESVAAPVATDINNTGKEKEETTEETTDKTETAVVKTPGSVAELVHGQRERIEADALTFYLEMLTGSKAFEMGIRTESEQSLTKEELDKVAEYVYTNNEHLEAELNEIREAVLSTAKNAELPDSSFALVKVIGEKENQKTVRALPYKKADGSLEKLSLRTALLRCNQMGNLFTPSEMAIGTQKLRAAAGKAGLVETTSAEDLAEAKAILEANNLVVLTKEENEAKTAPDDDELATRIAELEESLEEANTIISEREVEADELLEKISELAEKRKNDLVESVLLAENVTDEAEILTRKAELLEKTVDELGSALNTIVKEQTEKVVIYTSAGKTGMANGSQEGEKAGPVSKMSNELILTAMMGSPRARKQIVESVKNHKE